TFDLMSNSQTADTRGSTGATTPSTSATRASSPSVPSDTSTMPTVSDRTACEAAPGRPQVRVEDNGFSARLPQGGSLSWFTVGGVLYELIDRGGRLGVRVRDSKSPLLGKFFEVPVFDPDPDFVFLGRFTPFEPSRTFTIETAQEDLQVQTQAAGT